MVNKIYILFLLTCFFSNPLQAKELSKVDIYTTGTVYQNHHDKYEIDS